MKKLLIGLLLVSFGSMAAIGDETVRPKRESDLVSSDRFVSTWMANPLDYIITDTKTGCQYMLNASFKSVVLLGCFDEYKKAKK